MIDNDRFESIKNLSAHFEARKARASERLAEYLKSEWCFAILGLHTEIEGFSFDRIGEFRRVVEPPGEVELARALKSQILFGAIGRYSHGITYELAVNREFGDDDQSSFNVAWWIISALRVKTLSEFLVPAVADHSWSIIAALEEKGCHAQLLEDVPQARRIEHPVAVTNADFEWVLGRLLKFGEMLEVRSFRLAVDALTTHQHLVSLRIRNSRFATYGDVSQDQKAYGINWGDIVRADTNDPTLKPEVREVVAPSGNKTLRVFLNKELAQEEQNVILSSLQPLDTSWERADEHYVAIDVHPESDYQAVCDKLMELEQAGKLEYETCEAREAGSFDDVESEDE